MVSRSPRPDGAQWSVRWEKGPPDLFLFPPHPIFRMIVLPGVLFSCGMGCRIVVVAAPLFHPFRSRANHLVRQVSYFSFAFGKLSDINLVIKKPAVDLANLHICAVLHKGQIKAYRQSH